MKQAGVRKHSFLFFSKDISDAVGHLIISSVFLFSFFFFFIRLKAAGLGRKEIAEYIVRTYPSGVGVVDNEGRTPLHYAAVAKDGGDVYDLLVQNGADESTLDHVSISS